MNHHSKHERVFDPEPLGFHLFCALKQFICFTGTSNENTRTNLKLRFQNSSWEAILHVVNFLFLQILLSTRFWIEGTVQPHCRTSCRPHDRFIPFQTSTDPGVVWNLSLGFAKKTQRSKIQNPNGVVWCPSTKAPTSLVTQTLDYYLDECNTAVLQHQMVSTRTFCTAKTCFF